MPPSGRQRGAILILVSLVVLLAMVALFAAMARLTAAGRAGITERALAQAREALVSYAADRPVNSIVGPGYLPCPDLDGDGWAESTCGSLSGDSGQERRLGRLPWKTLGLPQLRDAEGDALWYAVSSKYKGLLNCGMSRGCLDMTPAVALGTITLRDPSGRAIHDGTVAAADRADQGGAVAVVIAPGPALARVLADGGTAEQRRDCAPGDCDASGRCLTDPPQLAARCNPANYLDRAPGAAPAGEDNADFVDRNDAAGRPANGNGFIEGPVLLPNGAVAVNDRLLAVTYRDVMPAIMRRVALEVLHCLRDYATRPQNGGRYPWPAPSCREGAVFGEAPDTEGRLLGSVADTPFGRTVASGSGMLERWWRVTALSPENLQELPTRENACRIAVPPDDAGPVREAAPGTPVDEAESAGFAGNAWWSAWQPYVSYALAEDYVPAPSAPTACSGSSCIEVVSDTGRTLARGKQIAVLVASSCALAPECDPVRGCARVVLAPDPDATHHAFAAYP